MYEKREKISFFFFCYAKIPKLDFAFHWVDSQWMVKFVKWLLMSPIINQFQSHFLSSSWLSGTFSITYDFHFNSAVYIWSANSRALVSRDFVPTYASSSIFLSLIHIIMEGFGSYFYGIQMMLYFLGIVLSKCMRKWIWISISLKSQLQCRWSQWCSQGV